MILHACGTVSPPLPTVLIKEVRIADDSSPEGPEFNTHGPHPRFEKLLKDGLKFKDQADRPQQGRAGPGPYIDPSDPRTCWKMMRWTMLCRKRATLRPRILATSI